MVSDKSILKVSTDKDTKSEEYVCVHNKLLSERWRYMLAGAAVWREGVRLQRCFKQTEDKDSEVMGSL